MPIWLEHDLSAHLYAIAKARAKQAGREFGPGADGDVRRLMQDGARSLTDISRPADQDEAVAQAAVDVVRLVEAMTGVAEMLPNYPRDILGEDTLRNVRGWFCPRRPFC